MVGAASLLKPHAPNLALVGHLDGEDTYARLLSAARGADRPPLTLEQVRPFLGRVEPMPVCDLRLQSALGVSVWCRYIDLFVSFESPGNVRRWAKRVLAACSEAKNSGARLAALGGFASIVAEASGMELSQELGMAFTTGNTLTAAVLAAQVLRLSEDPFAVSVTVVGAGGDVGSGLCRILHANGFRLTLVGRHPRPLDALAAELTGSSVSSWHDAADGSDVVVLVASAGIGGVSLDGVPDDAFVLDAGHPPNAIPGRRARYALAGRVSHARLPECDLPALLELTNRGGESHACLAEGEVLAFEGRWESYSVGRGQIQPARAEEILQLAARHGIGAAPLHFVGAREEPRPRTPSAAVERGIDARLPSEIGQRTGGL